MRIVCANQTYKQVMGPGYYDNMLYQELVPRDSKFEDFCFRAAFLNQRMHAYVPTRAPGGWTDQQMIPLERESENLGYCQFLFEFTKSAEPDRMAAVSMENASAIIKACITLMGTDDFMGNVKMVLSDILELSEAFSCRILLIDHEKREAVTFCEKTLNDELPTGLLPDGSVKDGTIPYEIVDSWEEMIGVSNVVIVKDEQDMEDVERQNPEWVRTMRNYEVTSLVLIPLRRGRKIIGYLYVVNFNVEKVVEVKELIEVTSFFLGSEISNYLLLLRLDEMSYRDELTGIGNRNAMNRRKKQINHERPPFGVVTLDLNSLKVVNDTEGQEAGDRLLIRAAEVLRGIFRKEDLYRIGGDEFAIIASDISREQFEKRLARLHALQEDTAGVSFASGAYWSDGSEDVRAAVLRSDQQMYADKQAYYLRHPEKKRN